jgi:hypothetical protein
MDTFELVPALVVMGDQKQIRGTLLLVHKSKTCCIDRHRVLGCDDPDIRHRGGSLNGKQLQFGVIRMRKFMYPALFSLT